MPSWNDSESSGASLLGDVTDMDYAPDFVDDPTFHGTAVDGALRCRRHNLEPRRVVAFEGSNTGRRYYLCQVQNEVNNCGFVAWEDEEWPPHLRNAICKLWGMYDEATTVRIDERIENGKLVEQLAEEKNKLEKKYSTLLSDVHKFMDCTHKQVMDQNLAKNESEDSEKKMKNGSEDSEKKLKEELSMLNTVHASQAEVMKEMKKAFIAEKEAMEKTWEDEKKALKDEKRKVERMLFELLKSKDVVMEKLKRIHAICEE